MKEVVYATDLIDSVKDGNLKFAQATAYSWGHSDATGVPIPKGSWEFGVAYLTAWAQMQAETRHVMHCLQECYRNWLATGGESIWPEDER